MQHNGVPVPLLSFSTPLFGGSMGARGGASPWHAGASTAGVAKRGGSWGARTQNGHPGPCCTRLFLTQPVQLVHVVVSGERNLGNVVIWRRTCPLGGNGTVQMNHREGDKGQGTWAQGWCEGAALGMVFGRMGAGDAGPGCWVLGQQWLTDSRKAPHFFPVFFPHISFPQAGHGGQRMGLRSRACQGGF